MFVLNMRMHMLNIIFHQCSPLTPPKVELKFPLVNFQELVYPRIKHAVLEVKQRDLLFSLVHNIYPNRQRLFQQRRTDDPLCQNPACKRESLVQDLEHIFGSCYKVRSAKEQDAGTSDRATLFFFYKNKVYMNTYT